MNSGVREVSRVFVLEQGPTCLEARATERRVVEMARNELEPGWRGRQCRAEFVPSPAGAAGPFASSGGVGAWSSQLGGRLGGRGARLKEAAGSRAGEPSLCWSVVALLPARVNHL